MLERPAKDSGASMRTKTLLVLLGITALVAYYAGRQSSHVGNAPGAAFAQMQHPVAKPVAFAVPVSPAIAAAATSSVNSNPAPTIKTRPAAAHAPRSPHRPKVPLGDRGK
ncbi:hypothetical protein ACVWVY_003362 [Bradyrhizobium sp. URHC0002]